MIAQVRPQEQRFWESARAAFSNMQFTVDLLIESGDLVVSNWTLTGTHDGAPSYGIPPSGKPVSINGTAILRMRDGKVVEHWGGPHCMNGIGLSAHTTAHDARSAAGGDEARASARTPRRPALAARHADAA